MPQVQKDQINAAQGEGPQLYGTDKPQNNLPFQQKLWLMFKPQEFVTIMNIDDEKVIWQYMPTDSETETFSEDGMQRMVDRGEPELWELGPGETDVLVGECAYRALDVLYKQVSAKKTLARYSDPTSPLYDEKGAHLPKNFNFADSGAQDLFIKKAYLGKATPSFGQMTSETVLEPSTVASAKEIVNAASNKK